jgi:2-polyprenyl-3-methyl-5-hydroxy-6-metoxy-1,4-benzoquinol methylase
LSELYEGGYGKATYGDINKVKNEFNRIQQLPSYRSDNAGRVRFVEQKWFEDKVPVTGPYPLRGSLLDIGSGLGIFPHAMAIRGWRAICVESDPLLVDNLNDLDLIAFEDTWPSDGPTSTLDLITFNKVLEHVEDPVAFLSHARPYCHKNSIVYIEVPSISAARVNFGREEFFIEHHHVFSAASVALLASKAGFQLKELYDIVEPSGKYTIRVVMGV